MTEREAFKGKPYAGNLHAWLKTIIAAAVLSSSALCAQADTYPDPKVDGLVWNYTVINGTNVRLTGVNNKNLSSDAADMPWTMTVGDVTYTVVEVGDQAFKDWKKLTGTLTVPDSVTTISRYGFRNCTSLNKVLLADSVTTLGEGVFWEDSFTTYVIPRTVTSIGNNMFRDCKALVSAWIPGPATVSSGTQSYASVNGGGMFCGASSLKLVLFGPNVKATNNELYLNNANGCKVFLPNNADWKGGNLNVFTDKNNEVIYYGEGANLDLDVDEGAKTITAVPTDQANLVKVLEAAPLLKSSFGWNTRITVTNAIELAAGSITSEMLAGLPVTFNSLMFKVNTQAQLRTVLDAFPASVPLAIDPSDAKEKLTIDQGREVYVRLSADGRNGRYTPMVNGLMIVFR